MFVTTRVCLSSHIKKVLFLATDSLYDCAVIWTPRICMILTSRLEPSGGLHKHQIDMKGRAIYSI